jgi:cytochrome c biogenesis protein CcmG/thiol:disulfide interchange protein DsbE
MSTPPLPPPSPGTSRTPRNVPTRTAGRTGGTRKPPRWLWSALAVGLVVLILVVVLVSRSSNDSSPAASGTATTTASQEQTRPVAVTGPALVALPDSGADPAVGTVAPVLKGQSFDGTPVTVGPDGHPKLVLFAAHWCPHCQREIPLLATYLKDHPLPSGVELFLVATGTNSAAPNYPPSAWLAKVAWPSPVMADDASFTAADAFGLPAYPFFVALDANNKVVERTDGEISTDDFTQLAQKVLTAS